MSLTPSDRRTLAKIEHVLQSRDPRLQSLFAVFTSLTGREGMPAREQLPRRGWRPRAITAGPATLLLLVAIIAVGVLSASTRACGPGRPTASALGRPAASAAGGAGRWDRACPAR
jgi:hypothetical protein